MVIQLYKIKMSTHHISKQRSKKTTKMRQKSEQRRRSKRSACPNTRRKNEHTRELDNLFQAPMMAVTQFRCILTIVENHQSRYHKYLSFHGRSGVPDPCRVNPFCSFDSTDATSPTNNPPFVVAFIRLIRLMFKSGTVMQPHPVEAVSANCTAIKPNDITTLDRDTILKVSKIIIHYIIGWMEIG